MKIITYAITLILSLTATPVFAQSWTAPTTTPPAGNIATPVNIGTIAQAKNGGLSVNAFSALSNAYFAGNVGIGTSTPGAKLDVTSNNTTGVRITSASVYSYGATLGLASGTDIDFNSGKAYLNNASGNFGVGTSSAPAARLSVKGGGTTTGLLAQFTDSANAARVSILDNGNVGIGNTAPGTGLTVGDNLGQSGTKVITLGNSSASTFQYTGQDSTHNLSTGWIYNATAGSAFGQIQTYSRTNPLYVDGSQLYLNSQSSAGNVGIGTTAPTAKLDVADVNGGRMAVIPSDGGVDIASGNDAQSYIDFKGSANLASDYRGRLSYGDGSGFALYTGGLGTASFFITEGATPNVGIGVATPGYRLEVNGSLGAASFFYTSDRSLKKNIQPLTDSLSKITKLQGVSFDWKKDGTPSVGLVAQDVEKVYPELVHSSNGIKSVEYGNLVGPLVEAIKEQQKQIDALKAEVQLLKENK